jgi:hypothetical protein
MILTRNKTVLNDDRLFPAPTGTSMTVKTRKDAPPPSDISDGRSFAIFRSTLTEPLHDSNKPADSYELTAPPMLTKVE